MGQTIGIDFHVPGSAQSRAAEGERLLALGRFEEALHCFGEAARLNPAIADYPYKLAMCAWNTRHTQLVEPNLRRALLLQPDQPILHEALGEWYVTIGKLEAALLHVTHSRRLAPQSPDYAVSHGIVLKAAGQSQEAWQIARNLLDSGFMSCRLALLHAQVAKGRGEEWQALESIERALQLDCLRGPRTALLFAAAGLLEHLGRYDEAFARATQANHLAAVPYDPRRYHEWVDRRITYWTPAQLNSMPRASRTSRRPVFILGMPRSGTSLVEQILACHRQVHGGGELDTLSFISLHMGDGQVGFAGAYPDILEGVSVRQANTLAGQYLDAIARLNPTATYVTDKMPLNFFYLGLIAILFPDCHVIHCTRNPLDTCLSCYFTNFTFGHEFSTDLRNLGLFYRDYRRLMDHWQHRMNFPMLEVKYEDVVADVEGQTRRMLEFLDLPWDPNCLEFHRSSRHVPTASREQVRKPFYRSSVGRWKRYERHLGPLVSALQDNGAAGVGSNVTPLAAAASAQGPL